MLGSSHRQYSESVINSNYIKSMDERCLNGDIADLDPENHDQYHIL